VFKDRIVGDLLTQQADLQYAYEEKIAALRLHIDRITSRQLLDQNTVEGRIEELATRQARLESRHALVADLMERVGSARSLRTALGERTGRPRNTAPAADAMGGPEAAAPPPAPAASDKPRPEPVDDAPALRRSSALPDAPDAASPHRALDITRAGMDRIEAAQIAVLGELGEIARRRAAGLAEIIRSVGIDPPRAGDGPKPQAGLGGPFVPLSVNPASGPFERTLAGLQGRIIEAERLHGVVRALPVRRPLPADTEFSSGFGPRIDPFTRGIAMHTGLDFRADPGEPVRAAGGGIVVQAGRLGGYGLMVEIDHGHEVTTRYAHLSRISVREGQKIAPGTVVGLVGSTGRSTGPHLHYETRVDGEPVDPKRFLRAGSRVAALD
jgi:murein DD-endopeptidase MepM/ murein hydrolase activator NlpD